MSKTNKYILTSFGIITLLCCAMGAIGLPLAGNVNDLLMGNKKVYLACDQLPDRQYVETVMAQHSDMIQKIEEAAEPGPILVDISSREECPEKGFLLIIFGGRDQSVKIQALLGDTFFGIPYQLENQ